MLEVVVGIVVGAFGHIGPIERFAVVALRGILHERHVGGSVEGDDPSCEAALLCGCGGLFNLTFGQSVQVGLVGEVEEEGVGGLDVVLRELEGALGEFSLDGLKSLLGFGSECSARTFKAVIGLLKQHAVFLGKGGVDHFGFIDRLDASEERLILHDVGGMFRQDGRQLFGHGFQFVTSVGRELVVHQRGGALQERPAFGQWQDGVVEGGGSGIVRDGIDFLLLLLQTMLHGLVDVGHGDVGKRVGVMGRIEGGL